MRWLWVLVVTSIATACAPGLRPPPQPPRTTSMGLSFTRMSIGNGLRVVLVKDPEATDVQVTTRYRVGAADDPADQPGMAHLVEHLMFQQTLGDQSLFAQLEAIATTWNAFTTYDATTYTSRARRAHLERLLSIEAVRMGLRCTSITDATFAREREVVIQEAKLLGSFSELMSTVHAALYPEGHPYRRNVRGTPESLQTITRDQACAFADAHYSPTNAVLVISGALTDEQVVAALSKFLAKIPRRDVAAAPPLAAPLTARTVEAPGPFDHDAVLVSWPLPVQPDERAQVSALTPSLVRMIDEHVRGTVSPFHAGDTRSPRLALVVVPAANESVTQVIQGIRAGLLDLPSALAKTSVPLLDAFQFDTIRQAAIYSLLSTLDEGSDRDTVLAAYVLAGDDPNEALAAAADGLRALQPETARQLALTHLGLGSATIVKLAATATKRQPMKLTVSAPTHDIGLRRAVVDGSTAHRSSDETTPPRFARMRTRSLPNGLRVVLLPVTSVPTVDVRIVFGAGSGDEGTKRGIALAAAHGLSWHPRYVNDALRFIAAGGTDRVSVGLDHTSFGARGVDMHIDVLLAGVRRWVREGVYDFNSASLARAIRTQRKETSEDDVLDDAVRAALYGPAHPYTRAGSLRHASEDLTPDDAEAFRSAYFTPDNATLVVAGRFDAALADQWIEFLFADWQGHARSRDTAPPASTPATLVKIDDAAQVRVQIAMPVTSKQRAHRLIAAAMLDEIASDVRHQLGASYTLTASLAETRLAREYRIEGWVEATRTTEAIQLVTERLARLRDDAATAEASFVRARQRVFNQLSSPTRSSSALGDQVEQDIALDRAPLSALPTAVAVTATTIEDMAPSLAELDLATAVVAMHGPAEQTEPAFAVLGRTPTVVQVDRAALAALDAKPLPSATRRSNAAEPYEYAAPITLQPGPSDLFLALMPGLTVASVGADSTMEVPTTGTSGVSLAAELGHRITKMTTFGLHAGVGALSGTYVIADYPVTRSKSHTIVNVLAFLQVNAFERIWGSVMLGLHADRTNESVVPSWYMGIAAGIEAGVDVWKHGEHRIGAVLRLDTTLTSDVGYAGTTLGLAYRRR